MTIIRTEIELARHNQRVEQANRNHPAIVEDARREHRALLDQWRTWERELPEAAEAFNELLGQPPRR